MTESERLERAIAHLETQRDLLGDEAVQAASAVLLRRLAALNAAGANALGREKPAMVSRLVGRKAELGVIVRRIERLAEGAGRFVSITGEAGIGKSRLVAELRNHVCPPEGHSSVQWLEGSALSVGRVISYWPFRQIVWQYAGITEHDTEDGAWNKLRDRIATVFDDRADQFLPYLASMLSLEVREEFLDQIRYLNSEAVRRQVFLSARRLFEAIARAHHLVLVFEDLQWIDESSARLLQHLLPLIRRAPVLIIGVSRPTVETPQSRLCEVLGSVYPDRYDEIRLSPLSRLHSAKLVANLINGETQPPALADKIVEKAEGNPFFVEEIVWSLVDEGILCRDSSSNEWRLAAGIETVNVPRTVHAAITARLDLLDECLKEVLKVAAIIGRRFLYRILREGVQVATDLHEQLHHLQTLGLIFADVRSADSAYLFNHDLTREAIYEGIDAQERKALHALVGSAIERLFAGRLEEFFGLLAYHYSLAEDWQKAQDYLFKAGDQAGLIAADAEAVACYTQAQHAYAQAFGDRWDSTKRAALERKMGEAFYRRGAHERALAYLHRSLDYLNKSVATSHLGIRLRLLRELAGQTWNRIRPGHLSRNDAITPDVDEAVKIHGTICWIHSSKDVERFLLHAAAMLNLSEREGFAYGMALGYVTAGISSDFLSMFRLAAHYFRLALEAAQRTMHPVAIANSYMGLALHNCSLADWPRALDFSSRAAELFKKVGDLNSWAYVTHLKCSALAYRGDYAQALADSNVVYETMDAVGDPESGSRAKWNEGYVLVRLGRLHEAAQSLNEAERLARSVMNPISRVISCHELAMIDLHGNRLDDALARVQDLEKMLLEYRTTQYLCVPSHNVVTQTYLQKAEKSTGPEKDFWIRKAALACKRGLKQARACYLVRPEAMRLNGTYKWITGKPRAATRCWKRALAIAEETGQRYDAAEILREMGNRLHDIECTDKSENIRTELGVKI